ncbi:MAG: hypothetical protein Q4C80_01850 [Bacillota bacterium]|nr:hypothetical protein [Bacillota bacterium]
MKTIRVALIGFGSVAQSFTRLLLEKEKEIKAKYDTSIQIVAIATKTRGIVVDAWGIDISRALGVIDSNEAFPESRKSKIQSSALEVAQTVDYDVLIELTPLEYASGHTATTHIEAALKRGKHVICANKGPLAWHFRELNEMAKEKNCKFRYESAVMDGTPVFNSVRENLQLCQVIEVKGILSRSLNYMLSGMERGMSKEDILEEGKNRGFIEANMEEDLSGRESLVKIIALANAMMDAGLTPADSEAVELKCSDEITHEWIAEAKERGNVIKYICRAYRKDGKICVSVGPEEISAYDMYASVSGTSLGVSITTDLMGTVTIIEEASDIDQTGYGVMADLISIIK